MVCCPGDVLPPPGALATSSPGSELRSSAVVDHYEPYSLDPHLLVNAYITREAEVLADLREQYRLALQGNRSRAIEVADLLFANPIMTVRKAQRRLGVSQPGATKLLRTLSAAGIVREVGESLGTRYRWFADGILQVLDPQLASSAVTKTGGPLRQLIKMISTVGAPSRASTPGVDLVHWPVH
jgi:hypothetical protein